jgi:hypothetical protein
MDSHAVEPNLLIYNRIPKCGSSSILEILSQLDRAGSLHLKDIPSKMWGSYGENTTRSQELKHVITASMQLDMPSNTTVAVGHISYRTFEKVDGYFGEVEYMQVFRQCESRFISHLLYDYNSSVKASQYRARDELHLWHQQLLGTPNVTACISDPACFRKAPIVRHAERDIIEYYVAANRCGGGCSPAERFQRLQSQANFAPGPSTYVTFGVVEHMREYLEMLECAYPNAFAGKMRRLKTECGIYFREHSSYLLSLYLLSILLYAMVVVLQECWR